MELQNTEIYVTESYYGKTKTLKQCEAILDRIRLLYKQNPTVDITNSAENAALEKLLKKQFGFKNVCINWYRFDLMNKMTSMFNAYTYVNATIILDPKARNYKFKDTGYYDKEHRHTISIQISYQLLVYGDLTGGEMLAIILHEIGHNFDDSVYNWISTYFFYVAMYYNGIAYFHELDNLLKFGIQTKDQLKQFFNDTMAAVYYPLISFNMLKEFMAKVNKGWNKILDKVPLLKWAGHIFIRCTTIVNEFKYHPIIAIPVLAQGLCQGLLVTPGLLFADYIGQIIVRKKEKFADSFSAAYGYGPEQSSALQKFEGTQYPVEDQLGKMYPILSIFRDINISFNLIYSALLKPNHGSNIERAQTMLNDLRWNLRNADLKPEVKNELVKQIEVQEKLIDSYLKKSFDEKVYISGCMQYFLVKVCDGDVTILERLLPTKRA